MNIVKQIKQFFDDAKTGRLVRELENGASDDQVHLACRVLSNGDLVWHIFWTTEEDTALIADRCHATPLGALESMLGRIDSKEGFNGLFGNIRSGRSR